MIIRPLRNNEKYKRDMIFAQAFNMKPDIEQSAKEEMELVAKCLRRVQRRRRNADG
jgi:predicted oxidoreductase